MVVVRSVERKADIYGSPNLKDWTHLSEFGPAGAVGGVWECPDLFPLAVDGDPANVKWVLVINLNPGSIAGGSGGQYFVGDFDGTTFTSDEPATYTPPDWHRHPGLRGRHLRFLDHHRNRLRPGPAAGGIDRAAGRHRVMKASSWRTASTTGTAPSPDFDITGIHGEPVATSTSWLAAETTRMSPALSSAASLPEGTLLFEGFEFPDDTNLAEAGWTLTGDFLPRMTPRGPYPHHRYHPAVSGYHGRKLVNTF